MAKWKFWQRDDQDDTTIITVTTGPGSHQISVAAKTSQKAVEIYKELKGEK